VLKNQRIIERYRIRDIAGTSDRVCGCAIEYACMQKTMQRRSGG
jgi:hypothetical protein